MGRKSWAVGTEETVPMKARGWTEPVRKGDCLLRAVSMGQMRGERPTVRPRQEAGSTGADKALS